MDYLNQFFNQVLNTPVELTNCLEVSIMDNPYINIDLFKRTMRNLDSMDEMNLNAFISANIDQIANDIINNDTDYVSFIMNYKFLDIFTNVINRIEKTYTRRLCCNKLAYDYLTLSENTDPVIKNKLITLSSIVNNDTTKRLIGLGIEFNDACNIAMARYSSSNEKANAERLNFILCNMSNKIITLQNVIYIYEILYERITPLFTGIMFETYTEEEEDNYGTEFMDNYSIITLAILNIINNLTSNDIRSLLDTYIEEWRYKKCPPVRFSFRSISNDYPKICNVVEQIMKDNYIP